MLPYIAELYKYGVRIEDIKNVMQSHIVIKNKSNLI